MPLRNLRWLIALSVLSVLCYISAPRSRYSRVLADNFDRVAREYYRPVNEVGLFEDTMNGLVSKERLDENSHYVPADDKPQFENDLNQEFVGIGILQALAPTTKQLIVLSPLRDGPAVAAGVRAGDRILKIDGQSTQGMSLADSSAKIKGRAGTSVTIEVQHPGAQPAELTIVRRVVHEDTVEGASRGPDGRWSFIAGSREQGARRVGQANREFGGPAVAVDRFAPAHHQPRDLVPPYAPAPNSRRPIGYVWIKSFVRTDGGDKSTVSDFRAALEQLCRENVRGLVLDLRDNRGGDLRAAVDICDMLVPKGQIVTMRGRDRQILEAYRASGKAAFTDFPVAVLVNGLSASASEIVAACLQDNGRAVVVGQRSYGKGTVQQVFDLGPALGAMKFTVATYWRPSGQDINRPKDDGKNTPWGVSPNEGYEVPVTDRQRQQLLLWQHERELAAVTGAKPPAEVPDRVLQKAVEYLDRQAKPD